MFSIQKILAATFAWIGCVAIGWAQSPASQLEIEYREKRLVGKTLAMDPQTLVLLRTDGRISQLDRSQITKMQPQSQPFQPLGKDDVRIQLQREFGSGYQVSMTQNFVVVHPLGDHQKWAVPFEDLYQRFRTYFVSRGMNLNQPEFPLVAVVLNTRAEFDRFLERHNHLGAGVLGYYSPLSNRIITYRLEGAKSSAAQSEQLVTLVHEAAHQSAFNTGVHSRYSPTPRWLSEGLATMFEATGVNNSANYSRPEDRVNQTQLAVLLNPNNRRRLHGQLPGLIKHDKLFQADPEIAYAISWGMSFYLAETRSREYFSYLGITASREPFQEYTETQRVEDFLQVVDRNLNDFELRMWKFLEIQRPTKK